MSFVEDPGDREEIATYERISLNNLLLKSKGAPYEDALRRIIEVRLQQNLRVHSLQEPPVEEVDSDPNSSILLKKKRSSQEESYIEDIPSISVTQTCKGDDSANNFEEERPVYGDSLYSRSTSSASKDEFQKWMLKNNGLDLHHDDQCQSWLRHMSRVQQGSALPLQGAESDSSADRSRNRTINTFENSDSSFMRSSMAIVQEQQSKCIRIKGQSSLEFRNGESDAVRPESSLSLAGGQHSNPTNREKIATKTRYSSNCDQLEYSSSRSLSSSCRRRSGSECGSAVSSTSTESSIPRSISSSRSSSRGKVEASRCKSSSCRLQEDVPARPFCPTLLARRENERILSGSRPTENFEKRVAQSVQNYFIRQAFASIDTSSDSKGGGGRGGGGGDRPAVGQYTPSTTIPYYQRHSKSMNDTSVSLRRQKHTFGDEVYKDSFMQKSMAQSSSLGGEGVPGVGQYTKAVVIPYYQRHSNKSPNCTRRHTWGSEQYDTFKGETRDSSDGTRSISCSDSGKDMDRGKNREKDRDSEKNRDRICGTSETCSSSFGSRSSTSTSTSASYASQSKSASDNASRDRYRDGYGYGGMDGSAPPRTPGERKFRTLLHMISNIGSAVPIEMRSRTTR